MQGDGEPWTSVTDTLAEARSRLGLIVDTLHTALDRAVAAESAKCGGAVATEKEAVQLLGMLPRLLGSVVAPTILQQRERQRQSMTLVGVAQPPPLSRELTLCHLLFSPLSLRLSSSLSSSSWSSSWLSGESDVLKCIARVLVCGWSAGGVEATVFSQTSSQKSMDVVDGGRTLPAGAVTTAALHALGDIAELCLYDTPEDDKGFNGSFCSLKSSGARAETRTRAVLRDAFRRSLCQTGLFDYLWRSLLFQPATDTQRVAAVRVLYDMSCTGVLRLPAAIARTRHLTSAAIWGERVAERILSDTSAVVKERLAVMLHEGLHSVLVGGTDGGGSNNSRCSHGNTVYWRRWLTNVSLRHLLGVVATGDLFPVVHGVFGTLKLVLEQEQLEDAPRQRRIDAFATERVCLSDVVEVCAARLVHLLTGPSAVNARDWDKRENEELRVCRLLVRGTVLLLRLVLKGVDRLIDGFGGNHHDHSGRTAIEEAVLVLRTCVGRQVMAAVLKCLEKPPDAFKCSFLTKKMRAELVRFVRDFIERASPPLFFLTGRLVPYIPTLLQTLLDVGTGGVAGGGHPCDDDELYRSRLHAGVCDDGTEAIALLGVMLWHSPYIRERCMDVLRLLQCTPEQRSVLFDVMETTLRSVPSHALEGLLIVDATGTLINETSRLRWAENKPRPDALECLLSHQQRHCHQRRQGDILAAEEQWTVLQQQRHRFGPKHSHATREIMLFILCFLRNGGQQTRRKDDASLNDGERCSVSFSPIKTSNPTTGAHADSVHSGVVDTLGDVRRCNHDAEEGALSVKPLESFLRGGRQKEMGHPEAVSRRESIDTKGDKMWRQCILNDNPSSVFKPPEEKERPTLQPPSTFPWMIDRNTKRPQGFFNRHQLESMATNEKEYNTALKLFAFLGKRYYCNMLTPQAALQYLQQRQNGGSLQHHTTRHVSAPLSDGTERNNSGTMLRLWTSLDVRQDDLFIFSLPLSEMREGSLVALLQRCGEHHGALRKALRTAPRTPRGRRWFLEDATTNVMGRLIAILQGLLRHVQREGEQAVREAIARMSKVTADGDDDRDVSGVSLRCGPRNTRPQDLHCGTVVEMAAFVDQCFPPSAAESCEKKGGDDAG